MRRRSLLVITLIRFKQYGELFRNFFLVTPQLWFKSQIHKILLMLFLFDNNFRVKAHVSSSIYKCDGFPLISYRDVYVFAIWQWIDSSNFPFFFVF